MPADREQFFTTKTSMIPGLKRRCFNWGKQIQENYSYQLEDTVEGMVSSLCLPHTPPPEIQFQYPLNELTEPWYNYHREHKTEVRLTSPTEGYFTTNCNIQFSNCQFVETTQLPIFKDQLDALSKRLTPSTATIRVKMDYLEKISTLFKDPDSRDSALFQNPDPTAKHTTHTPVIGKDSMFNILSIPAVCALNPDLLLERPGVSPTYKITSESEQSIRTFTGYGDDGDELVYDDTPVAGYKQVLHHDQTNSETAEITQNTQLLLLTLSNASTTSGKEHILANTATLLTQEDRGNASLLYQQRNMWSFFAKQTVYRKLKEIYKNAASPSEDIPYQQLDLYLRMGRPTDYDISRMPSNQQQSARHAQVLFDSLYSRGMPGTDDVTVFVDHLLNEDNILLDKFVSIFRENLLSKDNPAILDFLFNVLFNNPGFSATLKRDKNTHSTQLMDFTALLNGVDLCPQNLLNQGHKWEYNSMQSEARKILTIPAKINLMSQYASCLSKHPDYTEFKEVFSALDNKIITFPVPILLIMHSRALFALQHVLWDILQRIQSDALLPPLWEEKLAALPLHINKSVQPHIQERALADSEEKYPLQLLLKNSESVDIIKGIHTKIEEKGILDEQESTTLTLWAKIMIIHNTVHFNKKLSETSERMFLDCLQNMLPLRPEEKSDCLAAQFSHLKPFLNTIIGGKYPLRANSSASYNRIDVSVHVYLTMYAPEALWQEICDYIDPEEVLKEIPRFFVEPPEQYKDRWCQFRKKAEQQALIKALLSPSSMLDNSSRHIEEVKPAKKFSLYAWWFGSDPAPLPTHVPADQLEVTAKEDPAKHSQKIKKWHKSILCKKQHENVLGSDQAVMLWNLEYALSNHSENKLDYQVPSIQSICQSRT